MNEVNTSATVIYYQGSEIFSFFRGKDGKVYCLVKDYYYESGENKLFERRTIVDLFDVYKRILRNEQFAAVLGQENFQEEAIPVSREEFAEKQKNAGPKTTIKIKQVAEDKVEIEAEREGRVVKVVTDDPELIKLTHLFSSKLGVATAKKEKNAHAETLHVMKEHVVTPQVLPRSSVDKKAACKKHELSNLASASTGVKKARRGKAQEAAAKHEQKQQELDILHDVKKQQDTFVAIQAAK